MIYGKLIGGALHGAPRPIRTENGDVFTTDPNLLLQYGYKPIITAEQIWTAAEPPEDISADEALDIITGGADI